MRPGVKEIWLLSCLFMSLQGMLAQSVPAIGHPGTIEMANWNLEWFGKTGYGPEDEELQQKNIYQTLLRAEIDIWAFCEMSDIKAFDTMMGKLPEYGFTVAPYLPDQKTALIYRKSEFRLVSAKLVGAANKDSFSTGRFPFEVALVPLQHKGIDTLFIIVVHLKSNTGSESEKMSAYNSRKRSSEWLKMYLSKTHSQHFCAVLGDWNDDLDASIYNGLPSPFTDLQYGFSYSFITEKFTLADQGTTTAYPNAIDHQLISQRLKKYYLHDSCMIWRLDQYIPDYASTTSDHYPVCSFFGSQSSAVKTVHGKVLHPFYPNPASHSLRLQDQYLGMDLSIYGTEGKTVISTSLVGQEIDVSGLEAGLYLLKLEDGKQAFFYQLFIQH